MRPLGYYRYDVGVHWLTQSPVTCPSNGLAGGSDFCWLCDPWVREIRVTVLFRVPL